jgi:hypothetical protein
MDPPPAMGVPVRNLVAHALVEVEQGELGAEMRAFTLHDDAGAVGVSGQVEHAGQLGDRRLGVCFRRAACRAA